MMMPGRSAEHQLTHQDIADRLAEGERRFSMIEEKLDALLVAVRPIPEMQADIAKTKELVEFEETVANGAKYLKWIASVVAAIMAIVIAFKTGLAHIITTGAVK